MATFFPLNPESKGGKKVPLKPTGENKTGMSLPLGASTIFCELRSFVRSPETIRSKFDLLMATVCDCSVPYAEHVSATYKFDAHVEATSGVVVCGIYASGVYETLLT